MTSCLETPESTNKKKLYKNLLPSAEDQEEAVRNCLVFSAPVGKIMAPPSLCQIRPCKELEPTPGQQWCSHQQPSPGEMTESRVAQLQCPSAFLRLGSSVLVEKTIGSQTSNPTQQEEGPSSGPPGDIRRGWVGGGIPPPPGQHWWLRKWGAMEESQTDVLNYNCSNWKTEAIEMRSWTGEKAKNQWSGGSTRNTRLNGREKRLKKP